MKMKYIYAMSVMAVGLLLSSCGELFEFDEDNPAESQMKIDRTAIDIMVGETYTINVMMQTDGVIDKAVAWTSANPKVATFEGGNLKAVSPGHTTVTAEWLQKKLKASCVVNVYPQWTVNPYLYPYEMMVYADVTVGGRPMDKDCVVAAFGHDKNGDEELRGVGQLHNEYGVTYMSLRVLSPTASGDDVMLRCYDRKRMLVVGIPDEDATLPFDEYGYGSLSSLYNIEFE